MRSILAEHTGRPQEAIAFGKQALELAREHALNEAAATICFNLSDHEFHHDRYENALGYLQQALELARRRGSRPHERGILAETTYPLYQLGRWDEALAVAAQIPEDRLRESVTLSLLSSVLEIQIHRGHPEEARRLRDLYPETSVDVQEEFSYIAARAAVLHGEGRLEEALEAGLRTLEAVPGSRGALLRNQQGKQGFVHAVEAALALGRREQADELLRLVEELPAGYRPPYLEAHAHRFRARLDGDEAGCAAAAAGFAELGIPFWTAVSRLEQAELLGGGAEAERLLAEAREVFERLEAKPWLERVSAAADRSAAVSGLGS